MDMNSARRHRRLGSRRSRAAQRFLRNRRRMVVLPPVELVAANVAPPSLTRWR